MTPVWGVRHLLMELACLSIIFQMSMCNFTGDNVKCPDRLKIQLRNFHQKELVQLTENNSSYDRIDITNGLLISCTSKLPTAFHFEENSGSHFLTAGLRGNNGCYTAVVIVNVTTGTYVCSTITSKGIAWTDLLLNSPTTGYLNLEVRNNVNQYRNPLVLNCPTRKSNSTLTPCQQMYSYTNLGFASPEESINYVMRRHDARAGHVQTNPSCISSHQTSTRKWECEDYEECPCSAVENLLDMGQQICTRDILLKCQNHFDCKFTPWDLEHHKSLDYFECKNAIHFADTYLGDKYIGQIIDVTCKASELIFSQDLKLFVVFHNDSIIEMDQSDIVLSNNFYIVTSQFQGNKEMKGLKCSAPYLHLIGWQSQQTNTKAFIKNNKMLGLAYFDDMRLLECDVTGGILA